MCVDIYFYVQPCQSVTVSKWVSFSAISAAERINMNIYRETSAPQDKNCYFFLFLFW